MGETLEPEPVEMPAKKGFRDRGYSYHKYQLKKSTIPKEAEPQEPPPPGMSERAQLVLAEALAAFLSMSSGCYDGCYSFVSSVSTSADESAPAAAPPAPRHGLKHEPAVTVVPHESPREEYNPGLELRDPFQQLHMVSCCEDIFFAKAEEKACVVIDGQVQVPTVVDLTNGAPNKFEEDWKKKGVRYARFECPDREFAIDEGDVTGTPSALTTMFADVCKFLDEARASKRLPILIYDDNGMTRACVLCVMYLMHADRLSLTTVVEGVERDIDPIEDHIWKNKRFRMIIQNKAKSLGLDDDDAGQVWKTREYFAAAVRRITG
jgi:hypothetical protein